MKTRRQRRHGASARPPPGAPSPPQFGNVAVDRPRGRFEFTYDSGAAMGTTIAGHATNRIFVVVTSSGKTVVTAYPV